MSFSLVILRIFKNLLFSVTSLFLTFFIHVIACMFLVKVFVELWFFFKRGPYSNHLVLHSNPYYLISFFIYVSAGYTSINFAQRQYNLKSFKLIFNVFVTENSSLNFIVVHHTKNKYWHFNSPKSIRKLLVFQNKYMK